jgi:hypothetical protein
MRIGVDAVSVNPVECAILQIDLYSVHQAVIGSHDQRPGFQPGPVRVIGAEFPSQAIPLQKR